MILSHFILFKREIREEKLNKNFETKFEIVTLIVDNLINP